MEGNRCRLKSWKSIGQLAAGIAMEESTLQRSLSATPPLLLEDAFWASRTMSAWATVSWWSLLTRSLPGAGTLPRPLTQAVDLAVSPTKSTQPAYLRVIRGRGTSGEYRAIDEQFAFGNDEMQSVDLNRALESTLTVCRNEWKYVAEVVTDLDPELPLACCLPGACNQVFLNLIINAAHAIADKPGENVAARKRSRSPRVLMESGSKCGCPTRGRDPDEYRGKVFDPFFTTKEVGRGTGQGLAIAASSY